jgi:poly(3-hydroxybutyrate) depolymerase
MGANTCVDPKRVYASGCSNGGGMSYMPACNAADVIAAVAPVDFRRITRKEAGKRLVASLTPTNNTACTCTLPRPISVTAFDEGQDNAIVPYNGGRTAVSANCPPRRQLQRLQLPERVPELRNLAANTQVTLCTAQSANHCERYGGRRRVLQHLVGQPDAR